MNETLKTIHSLRTIHGNFSSQEINDEDMAIILDACVRAANASARQSYSIIVVKDRDVMKKLSGYAGSRTLIFCVDYNRIIKIAEHVQQSFAVHGLIPFVTGSTDTILAAQTAAIAAKSLGIDSMFTNGIHRGNMTRVYELLDIPEKNCFPLIALVLGYPDQEPDHLKGRLKGKGVVHDSKYYKVTSDELDQLVKHVNDPENHMWLSDDWEKKGLKSYLEWFYSVWSARGPKPEGKSQMAELLDKAGFME